MDSDVRNLRRLCAFLSSVLPFDPYLVRGCRMPKSCMCAGFSGTTGSYAAPQLHSASLSSADTCMSHCRVSLRGTTGCPCQGTP